ncbi:MAG: SDR family oxidoreductase [Nanoarchaeota archaeon]
MNVTVLGGAGYIGSVLCRKLLEKHHEVTVVDKGFFGFEGLKEIEKDIKIVKKDGFDLIVEDLKNYDCFINLSGLSNDPMADFDPDLNFKLNTDLTEFTAKLCKLVGIKYLFASTASIYDFGTSDEKLDVIVDENVAVNPVKYYSLSKYNAEQKLLELTSEHFKPIIFRKATVCGYSPRMRYDLVVNTMVKDALKNNKLRLNAGGENWRPLIDVGDMCEIYSRCVDLDKTGIYNAVGYNIRVSELALRIYSVLLKEFGHNLDIECDYTFPKTEVRNYRVDGSKLWKEIDFKPQTGIQDSVKGILKNTDKINDFDNPIYYNITWVQRYLQHWLKY